jgi:hypothetical protein
MVRHFIFKSTSIARPLLVFVIATAVFADLDSTAPTRGLQGMEEQQRSTNAVEACLPSRC